jgi:hypothetical protein
MKRFVPRIAAVLFLVVAGALAPAAAEDRPFNASGAGGVYYSGLYAAEFEVTHLGHSSLAVGYEPFSLEYQGILIPYRGAIYSASGDALEIVFDAEYYVLDPETGVVSATLTFTGGTGRFEDATGSADMTIDFDDNLRSFSFQIDGSIDY